MWNKLRATLRVMKTVGLCLGVLVAGGVAAWLAASAPRSAGSSIGTVAEVPKTDKVLRLDRDRIAVPDAISSRLGLKSATVARHTEPTALPPFQGSLALDSNCYQRVHTRFPGEVVEIGQIADAVETSPPTSATRAASRRTLRVGDRVAAGQLLLVVWSKDLGEKKSEFIDATSKLKADGAVLSSLRELYGQGGTAERTLRDAERVVESDRVAAERAERTLRAWRLTEPEIEAIRTEGEKLSDPTAKRPDPSQWARVEVRATQAGTVLDKSLSVGDIVDTTTDLLKIGDLTHLIVWAHVYEDDLPLLNDLPRPLPWTVLVPSRPGVAFEGAFEQVGAVIDPNQHTALVSGRVENPRGELKVGQFVTVMLARPVTLGELVVPTEALIEDGRSSVVFLHPDPTKPEYVRRAVAVTRRTRDLIYLAPASTMAPGDRIVTAGSLLLRDALEALPVPAGTSVATP